MITFSSDSKKLNSFKDYLETGKIAEKFFHTKSKPGDLEVSKENSIWMYKNINKCLNTIKDNGKIIGFTFVVPANKKLMNLFIKKKITERELFNQVKKTINYKNFDALYLCATVVNPKYRNKGLATKAFLKTIKQIAKNKKVTLFYWGYSKEGKIMAKKKASLLNSRLLKRV